MDPRGRLEEQIQDYLKRWGRCRFDARYKNRTDQLYGGRADLLDASPIHRRPAAMVTPTVIRWKDSRGSCSRSATSDDLRVVSRREMVCAMSRDDPGNLHCLRFNPAMLGARPEQLPVMGGEPEERVQRRSFRFTRQTGSALPEITFTTTLQ